MSKPAGKQSRQQGKPQGHPQTRPRSASHQVRIIGGQWKRTPLTVADGEGLRPTPDRVRETVFNWINHVIDNDWDRMACLDAFAGTGVLGFEAASRGAEQVVMIENFGPALKHIAATKDKLKAEQIELVRGDAVAIMQSLQRKQQQFDLIFLDPPYHQNWLDRVVPMCESLLRRDGLLYVESEVVLTADNAPEWLKNWDILRADHAGMVFYHLLQAKKLPQLQA